MAELTECFGNFAIPETQKFGKNFSKRFEKNLGAQFSYRKKRSFSVKRLNIFSAFGAIMGAVKVGKAVSWDSTDVFSPRILV